MRAGRPGRASGLVTANVDGLSVRGGVYYLSFAQDLTIRSVTYQDGDIVAYTPNSDT